MTARRPVHDVRAPLRILPLLVLAGLLSACGGPYTIDGRVVKGDYSTVSFVAADDSRLAGPGVSNVEVKVFRDPGRGNEAMIARGLSDGGGHLSIPLDAFGAGWMDEQWRLSVTRGYQSADLVLRLPPASADRRLLIMVAPGFTPPPQRDENLMDVYERFR